MERLGIPFRESLNRPNLIMGCERTWILGIGVMCFGMLMIGSSWGTTIFAIVTWFSAVAALRRMGKADPRMSEVYVRHVRYKTFYPARSRCQRNWRR